MKILLLLNLFVPLLCAQVISPASGAVWKVGQNVQVRFHGGQPGETVSLFFNNDRSVPLGGGPISSRGATFYFPVPQKALSPEGRTSELVAVHRINQFLSSVDSVLIKVVP